MLKMMSQSNKRQRLIDEVPIIICNTTFDELSVDELAQILWHYYWRCREDPAPAADITALLSSRGAYLHLLAKKETLVSR